MQVAMQLESKPALAMLNGAVSYATDGLAAQMDLRTARMLAGGMVGVALAVALACAAACCRLVCLVLSREAGGSREKGVSTPRVADGDACQDMDPEADAAPSGGYRSDSTSDDEGQGDRVASLAQKRAHCSNGV